MKRQPPELSSPFNMDLVARNKSSMRKAKRIMKGGYKI